MAEIQLVRKPEVQISEADREIARRVLFAHVDGLGEVGRKQWRRFLNRLFKLEPGEIATIKTHNERVGWWHRKHMALEQTLFENQEKFDNFDTFRDWLKIGAGFVEWHVGPKGGVVPVPKSISFAKLEQIEMEKVHADMVAFLRTEHAQKALWRHLTPQARSEMIEMILVGFHE